MMRHVVLRNGLRLLVREMKSAPVVALNLWVGSGSSDDPETLSGSAHFLEHMLFRMGGDLIDLTRTVHDAGGYLNAETGCDHTMFHQVVPSQRWKDVLGPATRAVARPALSAADVESERAVVIEESRSRDSEPGGFLWHRLVEVAFKNRPCGRPIVGTPEDVARVTADTLREYHATNYRGGNLVQVIVGDVDADEAVDFAAPVLEELPGGSVSRVGVPGPGSRSRPEALVYRGAIEQPYLALAFEGPHALHDDVPSLDALCGLLGVGESSRLWRSLRSSAGLVSDIGCGLVAYREDGLLAIRAVGTTDSIEDIVEGIFRETERLRREPPDAAEMRKNLRRLEALYVLEHETADSVASMLGYFETLGDYRWSEEYVDRLAGVGTDDVLRVAERYLDPERCTAVWYRPGDPSAAPEDRSGAVLDRAKRARAGLAQWVAEERRPWSPPSSLSRPDILRDSSPKGCVRSRLETGETMISCESSVLPIVSLTVGFRGGFLEEDPKEAGISYLAEKAAPLGTLSRTAQEISEEIEGLGSALSSAVERDGFGIGFTVLSKHLREATGILADVLVNATFRDDALDSAKAEVLSEIIETQDTPFRRAVLELLPLAFPDLPYGRPIRGTPETLTGLSSAAAASWHRRTCVRDRMTLCAVGDVTPDEAAENFASAFHGMPRHGPDPESPADSESGTGADGRVASSGRPPKGRHVIELTGSPQSVVAVCVQGPTGGTADAVVGRVIIRAMGMMGGRLWCALRERPPHAYRVGGTLLAYALSGRAVAYASSTPGAEQAVADGLLGEFARVCKEGLGEEELERTKSHLAGSLDISLVRSAARSSSYAMAEVMGAGYEYVEGMARSVRAVTSDDVIRVARTFMDPALGSAAVILKGVPLAER